MSFPPLRLQKITLDQDVSQWQPQNMSANDFLNLRNKLGLKQEELSDAFGLHGRNAVSRWENGLRKPQEVVRRLVCLLNDLPKKEAEEIIRKLGQYKLKKR